MPFRIQRRRFLLLLDFPLRAREDRAGGVASRRLAGLPLQGLLDSRIGEALPDLGASMIRKVGSRYRLVSHSGKNLGTFRSKAEAAKRERQVRFFKLHRR